jgi:hypothetical protein
MKRVRHDSTVLQRQRRANLATDLGKQDRSSWGFAAVECSQARKWSAVLGAARPERHGAIDELADHLHACAAGRSSLPSQAGVRSLTAQIIGLGPREQNM